MIAQLDIDAVTIDSSREMGENAEYQNSDGASPCMRQFHLRCEVEAQDSVNGSRLRAFTRHKVQ